VKTFLVKYKFFSSDISGTIWHHDSTTSCFGCETGLLLIHQLHLNVLAKCSFKLKPY